MTRLTYSILYSIAKYVVLVLFYRWPSHARLGWGQHSLCSCEETVFWIAARFLDETTEAGAALFMALQRAYPARFFAPPALLYRRRHRALQA